MFYYGNEYSKYSIGDRKPCQLNIHVICDITWYNNIDDFQSNCLPRCINEFTRKCSKVAYW